MAEETTPRGLSLEQAQILGLQRAQEEIRGEVTGIRDQLANLVQLLQGNNLQPQQGCIHGARQQEVEGIEDGGIGDGEAGDRGRPRRPHSDSISGIKLKVPPFRGTSSPEEYLEWVQKVEKIFDWHEYPEAKKCKIAALEFTDYALLWWENLKAQRRRDGEEDITTWPVMRRLMKKRFVPEYYKQELYIKLQTLRQGSLSVEEYVKEFELLMIRCDLNEPQEQTIARFLGGLKKEISNVVELQPFIFLEDVIKLAIKVERQQKRGGIHVGAATPSSTKVVSTPSRTWTTPKPEAKVEANQGSTASSSGRSKEKFPEPPLPKRSRDIKCFKCLGQGHIASECPNRRVMILHGEHGEIISDDEEETGNAEQEENFAPMEGDLLVVRPKLTLEVSSVKTFFIQGVKSETRYVG